MNNGKRVDLVPLMTIEDASKKIEEAMYQLYTDAYNAYDAALVDAEEKVGSVIFAATSMSKISNEAALAAMKRGVNRATEDYQNGKQKNRIGGVQERARLKRVWLKRV